MVSSTATVTVPYTDIIVTLTTTESTSYETSTSYEEILETVTAYSATSVATVTEVATAPTAGFIKKRGNKKKRGCSKTSSQVSTESTPAATSTDAASTDATSTDATSTDAASTDATSTDATSTDATSSTLALFPIASNCADLKAYSSACACINAVTSTVTATTLPAASTEVTTVTESSAVPSTSTSVVTVVVSSTVVVPAETTLTATSTGLYQSTVTVTSTTTPVAPTQTAIWKVVNGPAAGKPINIVSGYMQWSPNTAMTGTKLVALTAGGQVTVASSPTQKLYVHLGSSQYGVFLFETDAAAASAGDKAVTCSLAGDAVSCSAPSVGFDTMFQCGSYFYMAKSTWGQAGCTLVKFQLSA